MDTIRGFNVTTKAEHTALTVRVGICHKVKQDIIVLVYSLWQIVVYSYGNIILFLMNVA